MITEIISMVSGPNELLRLGLAIAAEFHPSSYVVANRVYGRASHPNLVCLSATLRRTSKSHLFRSEGG